MFPSKGWLPCPFVDESIQRCGPHRVQALQVTRWPDAAVANGFPRGWFLLILITSRFPGSLFLLHNIQSITRPEFIAKTDIYRFSTRQTSRRPDQ